MSKCIFECRGHCVLDPNLAPCHAAYDWHQAFIDERDRYDRLVDFELAEAAELAKFKANTQNVVIITFPGNKKKYLYSLPERINLRKGRRVFLRGTEDIGTVYRDSFRIGGDALNALVDIMGAALPLQPVIGMRFGDE